MTIGIGDVVPLAPASDSVQPGLLLDLFKGPCGHLHHGTAAGSFAKKLLRSDQKDAYVASLLAQGWYPADIANFCKPGFLPRLKLQRVICPWFQHDALKLRVRVLYSEQGIDNPAPEKLLDFTWPRGSSTFETDVTGNDVVAPSPGYDGHSFTAHIKIVAVDDPDGCSTVLNFFGTLLSTGWDFLAGMTVAQSSLGTPGCVQFVNGESAVQFAWTAVGPFGSPPLPPPVPLVRGFIVQIFGGQGFVN